MKAEDRKWAEEIIKIMMIKSPGDEVLVETICGGKYTLEDILRQVQQETPIGKEIIEFFLKPRTQRLLAQKNLLPVIAA